MNWERNTRPLNPSLRPPKPSSSRRTAPNSDRHGVCSEQLAPSDMVLIDAAFALIIGESRCEACQRPLQRAFRIDVHAPSGQPAWIATVSFRCTGWRRHRTEARVWVGLEGLRLGQLRLRT